MHALTAHPGITPGDRLGATIVFAILAGAGWGARVPAMQALRADYFGGKAFGRIMGFSSLVIMFGMIFGPVFAGVVYDVSGSYRGAFMVLACAAVVGALFFWLAVKPSLPVEASAREASPS